MKKTLMLLCLLTIAYLQYGSVLFYDDFNRTEGDPLGNGWVNIGPVNPIIEAGAMKLSSNSLQGVRRDFTALGITAGIYYVSWDWKITANNWLADAFPNGTVTYLRHDYEGNLYYDNTSDFSNPIQIGNLAFDTWANFKLKVNLDTDRFSLWLNSTLVADNILGQAVSDFTRFTFRAGSGSVVTQYVDNFIVYNDTPPDTPTNLTATGAVNDITLNWNGTPQDFLSYKIYRGTSSPATTFLAEVPSPQTSYIDNTAAANTDYFYRVKAVSMNTVESGFSNEVTAHLQPDIAVTPQVINVTVGQGYTEGASFTIANNGSYPLTYSITGNIGESEPRRSLFYNGVNDGRHVFLGNFGPQQIFTVSMWIKPYSTQNTYADILDCSHGGEDNWVIQRLNPGPGWNWGWYTNSFSLVPNVWQHFAITAENQVLKTYINGTLVGVFTRTTPFNYLYVPNLYLGNARWGGRAFTGLIDDVHISNIVRYNSNFNPIYSIPPDNYTYGYWNFNELSGSVCYDLSSSHNNAQIVGGIERSTDVPELGYISVNPSLGTINDNHMHTVQVSINSSNLLDGTYNESIVISSNDPSSPHQLLLTINVDKTPPLSPADLTFDEVQSEMNQIYLSWTANALADSVYTYKIYRRGLHDTLWTLKGSVPASRTWFIDNQFTGLDTTAVYYKITAVDWVDNESLASAEVMAWLQRFPAPTGVVMEIIRDRHVKLSWNPVNLTISGNPGTPSCYVIYRSNTPSPITSFYYVAAVEDTTFTHNWAAWFIENSKQFYVVTAYSGSFEDVRALVARQETWSYGELERELQKSTVRMQE